MDEQMNERLSYNLRCIEEGLALGGLTPERRFPLGMQLYVSTEHGVLSSAIMCAEEGHWIVVLGSNPTRVPPERRAAVVEAMARINYQQVIGSFDLDHADGEMRYRIGHAIAESELTPELVQRLVGYVLYVWDQFHNALMGVAYGGLTPDDAVQQALASRTETSDANAASSNAHDRDNSDEQVDVDAILKELGLTGPIMPLAVSLPFPNSYVVPGARIIAGEYPGAKNLNDARAKVRALFDAGVTTVIDLTRAGELAAYAALLSEEASARGVAVRHVRMPIRDVDVCAPEQMRATLDEIDRCLAAGETVYVHCWGGVGRTGTVVGCWLVRHGRIGTEALEEVQRLFETMSAAKVERHPEGSPQTREQRRMVAEWGAVDGAARDSGSRRSG